MLAIVLVVAVVGGVVAVALWQRAQRPVTYASIPSALADLGFECTAASIQTTCDHDGGEPQLAEVLFLWMEPGELSDFERRFLSECAPTREGGDAPVYLYEEGQDWMGTVAGGPVMDDPELLAAMIDALETEISCST